MQFDGDVVAVDTETTGLNPYCGDSLFMISLCYLPKGEQELTTKYIEYKVLEDRTVTKEVTGGNISEKEILDILLNPKIKKVFHNCNFDIPMLNNHFGISIQEPIEDTLWLAHICDNIEFSYRLKHLADKYAGMGNVDESELKKATISARRKAKKDFYQIAENIEADYWLTSIYYPDKKLCQTYAMLDAKRTYMLFWMYTDLIEQNEKALAIYELEKELGHITRDMEWRGVCVDFAELEKSKTLLGGIVDTALTELQKVTGNPEFDPQKAKDIKHLIIDVLKLPMLETTDKGNPSFRESVLHQYIGNPVIYQVMKYRVASKALQSFYVPFEHLADASGVIHPHFQQAGTRTGRYSCNSPNLQNITNPDNPKLALIEQSQVRRVFVPRKGYRWYSIDYAQLELRIFAEVAEEQKLLDAITHNRDLHTEVAGLIFDYTVNPRLCINQIIESLELYSEEASSEVVLAGWGASGKLAGKGIRDCAINYLALHGNNVLKAEAALGKKSARGKAKTINFLQIYGGGIPALMRSLDCQYEEASLILEAYFNAIPGTKEFMQELIAEVQETGYIENLHGRRLFFERDSAYKAVNYLIQGSAAYLLKQKMIEVTRFFESIKIDAYVLLNIHDEIIIEINEANCYRYILHNLKEIMQDTKQWYKVPMEVEINRIKNNWAEKELVNV